MDSVYERIEQLCRQAGVSITDMCRQAGVSRGAVTDFKMGRTRMLSTDTLQKIADYFGTTLDFLLGQQTQSPPAEGQGSHGDADDFTKQLFAAYGETPTEFTQDDIDDIAMYMRMVQERKKKRETSGG